MKHVKKENERKIMNDIVLTGANKFMQKVNGYIDIKA